MVDRRGKQNTRFVALVSLAVRFEANKSNFFANFDCFVVLTDCSDAEILRSGDFCADRQQQTTTHDRLDKPSALPLAHAHGVKQSVLSEIVNRLSFSSSF